MRVLRHHDNVTHDAAQAIAALGNFDGVHRGHQAVLARARSIADGAKAPLVVVTFEPHPRSFFAPGAATFRLTSFRSKARLMAELGVDILYALQFDREFSMLSAQAFVDDVLLGGIKAKHLVVGNDFAFGHKRAGNVELLREMSRARQFGLTVIEPVLVGDVPYSSSRIREALAAGDPGRAAEMLGHWWEIDGRVESGDERGRLIGFPTANVALGDFLVPRLGIYAVRAGIESEGGTVWRDGVGYAGRRPTFGQDSVKLEAHLFDFAADLYGQHLRVALVAFIRPDATFDDTEALRRQIAADAVRAREILRSPANRRERFVVKPLAGAK
jgi:riboflavin kinase/FMN adenylyltransferase